MHKKIVNKILRWGQYIVAAMLFLLAVYVTLGRSFFSIVSDFEDEIAAFLSQRLGAEVTIGAVEGKWRGFDPVIELHHVQVISPASDNPAVNNFLEVSTLSVQPAAFRSLFSAGWKMQRIVVGDVTVNLQQTGAGLKTIDRFYQMVTDSVGQSSELDWQQITALLATPTIEFKRLQLHWQEDDRTLLHLAIPSMVLTVGEADLAISGTIHQPDATQPLGQFSVLSHKNQRDSFDGTLYFNWRSPDFLTPVTDWLAQQGTVLRVDNAGGELWLTFQQSDFVAALVDLKPANFEWQQGQTCIIPVDELSGVISLQQNPLGWTLAGSDLVLNWAGQTVGPQKLLINSVEGSEKRVKKTRQHESSASSAYDPQHKENKKSEVSYVAFMDSVSLNPLRRLLLASQVLPDAVVKPLQNYAPGGLLNNVRIEVLPGGNSFNVAAMLNDVSIRAHGGAPLIGDLDGYLYLNQYEGFVEFSSQHLELGFPDLYHHAWIFEQAGGRVDWRISPEDINISGDHLQVLNPSGKRGLFRGNFSINVPKSELPGYFDLSLFVENADATLAKELVPGRQLDEAVHKWLQAAFTKGDVLQGAYLFSGEVGSYAKAGQIQSMLVLDVNDLSLKFHPDWPEVTELRGELEMKNNHLGGTIKSASISGTSINGGSFQLSNLNSSSPLLDVRARARPKSRDWHYWLNASPVAADIEAAVGDWKISGQSKVGFRLLSRFTRDVPVIRVGVNASKLNFNSKILGLDISDVSGRVNFDNKKGFTGQDLSGLFLKQRMKGSLTTPLWTDSEQSLQLQLDSRISVDELALLTGSEIGVPIEGEFDYGLEINVAAGSGTELEYIITTDLSGLSIQLPPPYQKQQQDSLELRLSRFWSFDNQHGRWSIDIKGWLDANLLDAKGFRESEIDTGLVRFGHQGKYKLPESGIEFVGAIPEVDVSQWQAVIADIQQAAVSEGRQNSSSNFELASHGDRLLPAWLSGFEVNIGRLKFGEEVFTRADISGKLVDQDSMVIDIRDDSRIEGQIYFPLNGQSKIRLDLAKFYLNPTTSELAKSELLPQDIPLVDVAIEDFRIGERILGSWSWQAEKRDSGVVFNNVEAKFPGATYNGRLSWLYDKEINVHTSILTGGFQGKRFQDFSKLWTDRPPLNSETFNISTGIVWGRRPTEFSWEHVTGKLSFRMDDGTLNDTSASTDIFRVFGILNTDAFTRRLRLDFSDLYVEGLAYDQIEGKARIQEGLVRFESPLAVQAPSSAFKITGTTNLVDDSLDMDMVVVLPLTKNLPLASLLIGAPQIGGAVFLIDQLLGEPLSSLTSATYHISGKMQNPKIKLAQIFEKKDNSPTGKRRWEDPE